MKTRRTLREEVKKAGKLPTNMYSLLLFSPIGRYGLIEDKLFAQNETINRDSIIWLDGLDLQDIESDPQKSRALQVMHDSMPQYQFLQGEQRENYFKKQSSDYFEKLRQDSTTRLLSHTRKVAFSEKAQVKCNTSNNLDFKKGQKPQQVTLT